MRKIGRFLTAPLRSVGLLIVVMILDAVTLGAQRPTSTTRIPISKDVPSRTILRVDTLWQYRTDTLRVASRPDTIVVTREILRADTIYVKNKSCWRGISWCTGLTAAALAGLTTWIVCETTDLCKSKEVHQDVMQSTTFSGDVSLNRSRGIRIPLLSLPLKP